MFPEDGMRPLYLLRRFSTIFKNASKIYLPVHFIILLLRLKRSKNSTKKALLWKAIKEFLGSNLFATCFAMSIPGSYCYISDIIPRATQTNAGMVISFLFSWAIFFDSNSRWAEMAIYVLAQWFEGYTYSLYKRKFVPVVPHWEVVFPYLENSSWNRHGDLVLSLFLPIRGS